MAAILAAAMSNLSAALNSLASTTVLDIWRPLARAWGYERSEDSKRDERSEDSKRDERSEDSKWLLRSRYATLFWGAVLVGVALIARQWGSVLQAGLSIASIVYGALLGVFLLGLLTKRVGEIAAMWGMSAGLAMMLYVRFATPIAFTWYVVIGASTTFVIGILVSLVAKESHD
jgi:SSS family solute:Na+ symporter